MQTDIKLRRTAPGSFTTPDHAYTVTALTAEDDYRTYRIRHAETGMVAVVCYVREVRESIAAHMASYGRTWHTHLVDRGGDR